MWLDFGLMYGIWLHGSIVGVNYDVYRRSARLFVRLRWTEVRIQDPTTSDHRSQYQDSLARRRFLHCDLENAEKLSSMR